MLILLCQMWFKRTVAVDSALLMQSKVRFGYNAFQFVSPFSLCNCGANHDGDCLGTCRAFMVTMLNCCRGELALSCSLCVGWHKRNLSSLAAASWHQEMGFWDTEEECGMERGWERYSEEKGHDYRSTMASDGGGFMKAGAGERQRENDTKPLHKHYCINMIWTSWAKKRSWIWSLSHHCHEAHAKLIEKKCQCVFVQSHYGDVHPILREKTGTHKADQDVLGLSLKKGLGQNKG